MSYVSTILVLLLMMVNLAYASVPKIFAHRGGKDDLPENTIYAFEQAISAGVEGIELDIQLTKDKNVVVYHPYDLSVLTNGKGAINSYNYDAIHKLDAAFKFDPLGKSDFPQRGKGHYIPTLEEVLSKFKQVFIIIDFKSLPAEPIVEAVIKVVNKLNAWDRLIFYSTNQEHLNYLKKQAPHANIFENRNTTKQRLLVFRNHGECCCYNLDHAYAGFELDRKMVVEETFTLGKDTNNLHFRLWDENSMQCFRQNTNAQIIFFDINTREDYNQAKHLGADAVFSDTPITLLENLKVNP